MVNCALEKWGILMSNSLLYFIYDGSFEGLLSSVYDAYYSCEKPDKIMRESEFYPDFFSKAVYISTDYEKYSKVFRAIKNKVSSDFMENVYYTFLSETPGASMLIYEYIKLGFLLKDKVDLYLHNQTVLSIQRIVQKVNFEVQRMNGFLRFSRVGSELYYASMEPDHNILCLIAPHFVERFASQQFIIYDLRRESAAMYNKQECVFTKLSSDDVKFLENKNDDMLYQTLWKDYFKSTTIEERRNVSLQKRLMPVRYWKHLTEYK